MLAATIVESLLDLCLMRNEAWKESLQILNPGSLPLYYVAREKKTIHNFIIVNKTAGINWGNEKKVIKKCEIAIDIAIDIPICLV